MLQLTWLYCSVKAETPAAVQAAGHSHDSENPALIVSTLQLLGADCLRCEACRIHCVQDKADGQYLVRYK